MEEDPVDRIEAPARRYAFWVVGAGLFVALVTTIDQGWWPGLIVAAAIMIWVAGGYGINLLAAAARRRRSEAAGMPALPDRRA